MGRFTRSDDPAVDAAVERVMGTVKDAILAACPRAEAILLAGSFGRGEGSALRQPDGSVRFLKDFDLVVLTDEAPPPEAQRAVVDDVYRRLGLENPEDELFRFQHFVVDVMYVDPKWLGFPDLFFEDLACGSHLVHAREGAPTQLPRPRGLPPSSGARLLFEKTVGLVGHASPEFLATGDVPRGEAESLAYECHKVFVEMGTASTILLGKYRPTYAARLPVIEKELPAAFPRTMEAVPDLLERIRRGTAFKLEPHFGGMPADLRDTWDGTRRALGVFTREYLAKAYGADARAPLPAFAEDASRRMGRAYFRPLIRTMLERKVGVVPPGSVALANVAYGVMGNLVTMGRARRRTGSAYLRPLLRPRAPPMKFFLGAAVALQAVRRDLTLDPDLAAAARKHLSYCTRVGPADDWATLRQACLEAYRDYSGAWLRK